MLTVSTLNELGSSIWSKDGQCVLACAMFVDRLWGRSALSLDALAEMQTNNKGAHPAEMATIIRTLSGRDEASLVYRGRFERYRGHFSPKPAVDLIEAARESLSSGYVLMGLLEPPFHAVIVLESKPNALLIFDPHPKLTVDMQSGAVYQASLRTTGESTRLLLSATGQIEWPWRGFIEIKQAPL